MKKIMFNEDWIHYIWTRHEYNMPVTEQTLKEFIYQYKGTQITDFAMNVTGAVSMFPSKIRQTFCDKYTLEEEGGMKANFKDTWARLAYEVWEEKKLDMYRIWIDTLREIGIKPWISVRVNDCHGFGDGPTLLKSERMLTRSDLWRIRHREASEYYDKCLDFELEEARLDFLAYIEEVISHYRPDGLELDFTRETHLFMPGREQIGRELFNDVMKDVRALCDKYSPEGEKMPIHILVNGTAQTNLEMGLDVAYWAENGLIDSVTLLSRWNTTNTDYEIGIWRRLLGDKIEIGGGQQLVMRSTNDTPFTAIATTEAAYGQATANLYNGCDFVYLYNYMDITESGLFEMVGADEFHPRAIRREENLKEILRNVGEYETASKMPRSHVLTFDDFVPFWMENNPRLPIYFEKDAIQYFKIATGAVGKDEKAQLRLGFDRKVSPDSFRVFVNCKPCNFAEYMQLNETLTDAEGHVFDITCPEEILGRAIVEITLKEDAVLKYAEIFID